RAHPETVLVAGDVQSPPVDDQLGALLLTGADQAANAVAGRARDDRAHLAVRRAARADLDRAGLLADRGDQVVGRAADRHRGRDRHAPLAGRTERRGDEVIAGVVDAGVGEDDRVVLGPAESLHPLAVGGAGLVDVAGDRRRAD